MQNSGADVTQSGGPVIGGQQDGVGPTEALPMHTQNIFSSTHHIESLNACMEH
jgi:hypothetical protein